MILQGDIDSVSVHAPHCRSHNCFPLAIPIGIQCRTLPHPQRQEWVLWHAQGHVCSSSQSAEMNHFLLRQILFCMEGYSVSSSLCLKQWCLYNLRLALWDLGGLNSIFDPPVKYFYCLGSDAFLLSVLFAILFNWSSAGTRCLCCPGAELGEPQRHQLVQWASWVLPGTSTTLCTSGTRFFGILFLRWVLKEVPVSFSACHDKDKIFGVHGVTTGSCDKDEACVVTLTL